MPELRRLRSSYGGGSGGSSETALSVFSSSGSVSVDRCSSGAASDDHHENLQWSSAQGLDLDPKKNFNGGPYLIRKKLEKAEVAIKEYSDAETDGENQSLFSARSSFSHTNKEGQYRKSRSEILLRKSDRRRPASLDFNNQAMNVTSSSPRLGAAMKSSGSSGRSGMFPSPGTPNYRSTSFGVQKGWSSERVPLQTNANRVTFVPYNNGKNLPSKWEDAERWIISPAAEDGALKPLVKQPQKRPKAKSGPLGPLGSAYYSMYSPAMSSIEGGNVRNFVTESSFSTGVNGDNSSMIQYQDGVDSNGNFHLLLDSSIARSSSVHGCSERLSESLLRITQDDKIGGFMDAATDISRDVSRRDMATQMSPDSSPSSSPRRGSARRTSSSVASSIPAVTDLQHVLSSKADIRDVQVDDRVTLTRYCIKSKAQIPSKGSRIVDDWKNEGSDVQSADLEASEIKKSLSTVKREEAKITAWENLQKAKADAAIRKLEVPFI
ncbi:hypothetical protein CTI12_AA424120 [Artemisia annua]|uniref:Remorin C-terminal domain-containing protein n=1 Tax=Artemisia annua TaxID=35608 RepID=A0A2U1LZP9_ARTAN|nr:hypothetical protein CTI12_AA424120 [Artemisia annua]